MRMCAGATDSAVHILCSARICVRLFWSGVSEFGP